MNKWKIAGKVALYVLAALVILLILLHLGVTAWYHRFFMNAQSKFLVPGLDAPFVHQGFDYVEQEDVYLVSGYMNDGSASRIYIRDGEGDTCFVPMKNANGTDYTNHSGGICHNGRYVYVAGDGGLEVLTLDDVLDGGNATIIGRIETGFDISCCTFYDGYLLAGEFYRAGSYETLPSHWQTTPDGTTNPALIVAYRSDDAAAFGIDTAPVAAISIPEQVQGFCFTATNEIVLSSAYGAASSTLSYHRIHPETAGSVTLDGATVPLVYLDSSSLIHSVDTPPMSEEILCRDGAVYIMNESASNKYIFGKFIRGYQVFAYEKEDEN